MSVFSLFDFAANSCVKNKLETLGKVPVEVEEELYKKDYVRPIHPRTFFPNTNSGTAANASTFI